MNERPKVGIGVIVIRDGKILLGKRKGAHGEGTWSFPGGHLESFETFEDAARREVKEETGIDIASSAVVTVTNDFFPDKHYITIYMESRENEGEPNNLEPDKCHGWDWFSWDDLPRPLFLPIKNLLAQGYTPDKK